MCQGVFAGKQQFTDYKLTIICQTKQMFSENKTFATFVCQSVCEKLSLYSSKGAKTITEIF